ncbi:hypothetical protein M427DRAFT_50265 [Gonapodya prolifera JEL478]|uniref:Uncharacterized protein n=1 Tax=Gonapodya prolifera (strain JEL478) TaxID=1344416 RepID=A0A138ZWG1_GONPJ|nr:hypothetical protein M427DRAFT_50265 [Gonapodya prolifera JEL478]|eukprot:KXS08850.1 hypothetical protein M427DRAFT_50265 [Gonapodya prolifera JEL478]
MVKNQLFALVVVFAIVMSVTDYDYKLAAIVVLAYVLLRQILLNFQPNESNASPTTIPSDAQVVEIPLADRPILVDQRSRSPEPLLFKTKKKAKKGIKPINSVIDYTRDENAGSTITDISSGYGSKVFPMILEDETKKPKSFLPFFEDDKVSTFNSPQKALSDTSLSVFKSSIGGSLPDDMVVEAGQIRPTYVR